MHSPPAARQDLTVFRQRLQHVLKDNFPPYWDYLRKYVQAKLSKRELDQISRKLLGENNLYLHNAFIQALLANSRSPHLPDVLPPIIKKHPHKTNQTLPKKVLPRKPPPPIKKPPPIGGSKKPPRGIPVPLLGPEYNVLCARLQKIAIESGLSGITQDAIQFMMLAVEVYIKQMCKNAKPIPHHPLGSQPAQQLPPPLSLNDLYKTTVLHPSLLGEDFLLHQERLSLSLM